ncbi:hypothetical protein KFU94_00925 [Chloroflexi bacterium TSY]|nr:hypothetical protein [Chloroflexi bacterium TSY]
MLAISYWLLAIGCQLSAIGYRLSADGSMWVILGCEGYEAVCVKLVGGVDGEEAEEAI